MAQLRELTARMREELADTATPARFSDSQYISAIARAARRIASLMYRNDIELGRTMYVFSTEPGVDEYYLPGDFQTISGLYRPGAREIPVCDEAAFEAALGLPELSRCLIRGDTLLLAGPPSTAIELHLSYWPELDTAAWTMDDETPWSGKCDELIFEYACLRLRNVDEENIAVDLQLSADLESGLLTLFASRAPVTGRLRGWV